MASFFFKSSFTRLYLCVQVPLVDVSGSSVSLRFFCCRAVEKRRNSRLLCLNRYSSICWEFLLPIRTKTLHRSFLFHQFFTFSGNCYCLNLSKKQFRARINLLTGLFKACWKCVGIKPCCFIGRVISLLWGNYNQECQTKLLPLMRISDWFTLSREWVCVCASPL